MRRIFLAAVLAVPVVSLAVGEDIPADREIVQIRVSSNTAMIEVAPGFSDAQGCSQSGSGWLKIDLTTDKSVFATVLAAATAKHKVGFGLLGCAGGATDYPIVKRVDVTY